MMRCCAFLLIGVAFATHAADKEPARKGGSSQPIQTSKCNDVPAHPFDLILGRPTSNSVTVSVLCYEDAEGFIAYGTQPGKLAAQTPARPFGKGEPAEIVLSPLQPNTRYLYQLHLARTNSGEFTIPHGPPAGQHLHLHHHGGFAPGRAHRSRCSTSARSATRSPTRRISTSISATPS